MNEVDKINEQIAALTEQRDSVMLKEKTNVLAKMKADIKLYGFKTTDFKCILATRAKRGAAAAQAAKKKYKLRSAETTANLCPTFNAPISDSELDADRDVKKRECLYTLRHK